MNGTATTTTQPTLGQSRRPPFVFNPRGLVKSIWDSLGVVVIVIQIAGWLNEYQYHHLVYTFCDAFYIFDIVIRFRTCYVDPTTKLLVTDPKLIAYRYLTTWFFLDFLLAIPYVALYNFWTNRPAVQLAQLRDVAVEASKNKEKGKGIFSLIRNKTFRQDLFRKIKNHIVERRIYVSIRKSIAGMKRGVGLQTGDGISLRKKPVTFFVRKVGQVLGFGFRTARELKVISQNTFIARQVSNIFLSLRTAAILLFPRFRKKTLIETIEKVHHTLTDGEGEDMVDSSDSETETENGSSDLDNQDSRAASTSRVVTTSSALRSHRISKI